MEKTTKNINEEEPLSIIDDFYRFPSCEFPRSIVNNSESIDYTRFNSCTKGKNKRVRFNQNVTIVNIQSHKKLVKSQNYQNIHSIIEEDFNEEKDKKCVNCNIF